MTVLSETELSEELIQKVAELKQLLPLHVNASDLTQYSKLPFKVYSLNGSLAHRIHDLTESILELIHQNKLLGALILTRSVLETIALSYELNLYLKSIFSDVSNILKFDEFLMKGLFGCKDGSLLNESHQVLKLVNRLNKLVPNIRKSYDRMSEYVHPNYAGCMGAFSTLDQEERMLTFVTGSNLSKQYVQYQILSCLTLFVHYYEKTQSLAWRLNLLLAEPPKYGT